MHNCAGDYSIRCGMHVVCPQLFLSYTTIEPALVADSGPPQTGSRAFNLHSLPQELVKTFKTRTDSWLFEMCFVH